MNHESSNPVSEGSPLLSSSRSTSTTTISRRRLGGFHLRTGIPASLYVVSGVTQPLIMTLLKNAGVADPSCQLYMVFYYLGPASVGFLWCWQSRETLPSSKMIARAGGITLFDIAAQALNYSGAALAGPTIFAIVYSSVTVWTAVFSRLVLQRQLLLGQWMGVFIVFGGLAITALDRSVQMGSSVAHGLCLVTVGSAMHGLTYVMCEIVMVVPDEAFESMPMWLQFIFGDAQEKRMTVIQNCVTQGFFAVVFILAWQVIYTVPHFEELVLKPMHEAGTSVGGALVVLGAFALANLVHAFTYFFTLRHFPGGATSAGVMKGLQAVLVFVVTDYFFCGHTGGTEMCFTTTKLLSLITVVGGVGLFGVFTEKQRRINEAMQQEDIFKQQSLIQSKSTKISV